MSENSSASDFLYIILTLVAVIISLVKKTSSKQKGISDQQIAKEEQSETQSSLQSEMVADYPDSVRADYFSCEFAQPDEPKKEEKTCSASEEQENIMEIEESIDFDARTAFIYSEILTHKYNL